MNQTDPRHPGENRAKQTPLWMFGTVFAGMTTLFLLAAPSRAWETVGHKAVAIIAQHRLSPAARKAVDGLLGKDPGGHQIELVDVAGCADGFAHDPGFLCDGIKMEGVPAATIPWHFINIPISAKDPKMSDYCPKTGCLWSKIGDEEQVLRDPAASRLDKQNALIFLVHLVGDAHQPLHCADDKDFGANKKLVDVEFKGQKISLHKIWDEVLMDPGQVDWRLPTDELASRGTELSGALEHYIQSQDAKTTTSWGRGDLTTEAVLESWLIAKDQIYPEYARDHGTLADAKHDDVGDEYRKRMQPIARQRLAIAGVRLAELLNRDLGSK